MHKILLVDDHPIYLMALSTLLTQELVSDEIAVAKDGEAAWEMYKSHQPDLMIVDLNLPTLSGVDFVKRVRVSDNQVRILVFSSARTEVMATKIRAIGANGYVQKTEDISQMLNAIRATLSGFDCFPSVANDGTIAGSGRAAAALSPREITVLSYLVKGHSNQEIADLLHLSHKTISTHKAHIFQKTGISNIVDLAEFARENLLFD
ncbi:MULTISPECIES: response regulator transcription factor [unclassified Burkholderia]|uniref:response regulator transcription factor n=1 Tax=unclassified Burkholderia TaxID=2613784 RepID=UPI00075B5119|nr:MULTISPECIES: response regulator transcription factor [unclassified Burkholderia]KUY50332.1 LuxR family transcriptional regulator [Burkholderia sp. RF2-non_BP3]KUY79129.1 LuxR family transcriptional regulator [Burkholderia sp. RF4-BP95]KUY96939.1 LuxR family transcriptional regulator [Burkholderia sp. RF7-non_BP1]KUZ05024.1 LuxR family transcriptional regulator [Burkholderia sp. RF7-non_BP4]